MKTALWIIAICEAIRAVQNLLQLWMLKQTDKEFARQMLEEYERSEE